METEVAVEESKPLVLPWAYQLLWKFKNDKLYDDDVEEWLEYYEARYVKNPA